MVRNSDVGVLCDVNQLLNLAIGSPEAGAVNYNLLHTLLAIIVRHLNLSNYRLEFQGSESNKIKDLMLATGSPKSPIELTEYALMYKQNTAAPGVLPPPPQKPLDCLMILRNRKDTQPLCPPTFQKMKDENITHHNEEPIAPVATHTLVTKDEFGTVIKRLHELEGIVDGLPKKADELMGIFKSKHFNPDKDIWQILRAFKRLDSLEVTINDVLFVTKTIASEIGVADKIFPRKNDDFNMMDFRQLTEKIIAIEKQYMELQNELKLVESKLSNLSIDSTADMSGKMTDEIYVQSGNLHGDLLKKISETGTIETKVHSMFPIHHAGSHHLRDQRKTDHEKHGSRHPMEHLIEKTIRKPFEEFQQQLDILKDKVNIMCIRTPEKTIDPHMIHKVIKHSDQLVQFELNLESMGQQITDIENELNFLANKVDDNVDTRSLMMKGDVGGIAELYDLMGIISEDVTELKNDSKHTEEFIQHTNRLTDEITSNINRLSATKLDSWVLDEYLSEKADINSLEHKLGIDVFDLFRSDIRDSLSSLMTTVSQNQKFSEIKFFNHETRINDCMLQIDFEKHKEKILKKIEKINGHIDKINELYINKKEAAGSKKKLLDDVNCISCNAAVVMRVEENGNKMGDSMSAKQSLRPYYTYELDNIRKKMTKDGTRMLGFRAVTDRDKKSDHFINRYCGGSHTMFNLCDKMRTRQKNTIVTDKKNQGKEYFVEGDDGVFYHAGPSICVCTETNFPQPSELSEGSKSQLIIENES